MVRCMAGAKEILPNAGLHSSSIQGRIRRSASGSPHPGSIRRAPMAAKKNRPHARPVPCFRVVPRSSPPAAAPRAAPTAAPSAVPAAAPPTTVGDVLGIRRLRREVAQHSSARRRGERARSAEKPDARGRHHCNQSSSHFVPPFRPEFGDTHGRAAHLDEPSRVGWSILEAPEAKPATGNVPPPRRS